MQLLIVQKFHCFDPPDSNHKRVFDVGQIVDSSDVPADQSTQAWISNGLAREAHAAPTDSDQ
ncbi:MAG: hypothetical protein U1E23_09580 [Reyranellaceae bacterium]